MKSNGNQRTQKIRFTKAALSAVNLPDGKPFIEVQDAEITALRCRVSQFGRLTMFLDKKVGGHHVRKTLGVYLPGTGGNTIDYFRGKARAELSGIDSDAQQWLEGEADQDANAITVEGAFDLALKASRRGPGATRGWQEAQKKFTEWMKAQYPFVTTWARVRRQHVREYMEAQQPTEKSVKRGITKLSATRMRLLMQPISQTARYLWLEFELPNVAERLGVSAKPSKSPAPVYLADVLMFLEHLRGRGLASLEAGAALAGLAGLSLMEAIRLTWNKVDLQRGLIEIGGEVKNKYRNRVIPIPERCREALQRAYNARPIQQVQDMDGGRVVTSPQGCAFDGDSWENYGKLVRAEFRAWNPKIGWKPKDLRNTLPTLAALKKFSGDVFEQYIGHSAKSVTARHYIPRLSAASIGEAAQLENEMQHFKTLVVDFIEREIKALKNNKARGARVVAVGK